MPRPAEKPAKPAKSPAEPASLTDLTPDPANRRRHTARNIGMVVESLEKVGTARSIVIDETNTILAGNGVHEAARLAGLSKVRVVDVEGDEVVAVRRRGLTPAQKRALALYDNRTGELSEWNAEQLQADKADGLDLAAFWTAEEEAEMFSRASADEIARMAEGGSPVDDPGTEAIVATSEYSTFSCPLTLDQERQVRAVLRRARRIFHVDTTGQALAAALLAWHASVPEEGETDAE